MTKKKFDTSLLDDPRVVQRDACGVGFVAHRRGFRSYRVVQDGLKILSRMDHRGGRSADDLMSDGAGLLLQIPHEILLAEANQRGLNLPHRGRYSLGMFFLPQSPIEIEFWSRCLTEISDQLGLKLLFLRDVPIDSSVLSPTALSNCPHFQQAIFVPSESRDSSKQETSFTWNNFVFRKKLEEIARQRYGQKQLLFYVASLSTDSVCYKALTVAENLGHFYRDLINSEFNSAYALVHLRFSTNTMPAWPLAQPFRMICHNGEINTLRGNINAMHARSSLFDGEEIKDNLESLIPVCTPGLSDSAMLDNTIEFLVQGGRPLMQTLTMVIPEPWEKNSEMPRALKSYYEFQSCLMEPWDGPAFIGFAHSNYVGAILDRNGLRPGRYCVTNDDFVVMASEAGVLDTDPESIVSKGRLSPGRIFLLDLESGRIIPDEEIKNALAQSKPYEEWLAAGRKTLSEIVSTYKKCTAQNETEFTPNHLLAFGYTQEDLQKIIAPMANDGKEPEGSMGNDTPLAVLSEKRPLLFNYFRQLFAQVTNPPIDAIREELVTSLSTALGGEKNILTETPEHCRVIALPHPILTEIELSALEDSSQPNFKIIKISTNFKKESVALSEALENLSSGVSRAVALGARTVILSDQGVDANNIPLPSLLALSSVHHALIRSGQRKQTSLIVESGEPREVHHFAALLGFGADAICPYLTFTIVKKSDPLSGFKSEIASDTRQKNYIKAICDGLLKIMSKMGISTLQSYRGAQIFESLGLDQRVIDQHFSWTPNRIQGITLEDIEADTRHRHSNAFNLRSWQGRQILPKGGIYQWKRTEEKHLHSPEMISRLQNSLRINSREEFSKFCKELDESSENPLNLRALLKLKKTRTPVPLPEVEPVTNIVKRFATGAMSFGSISKEAHETIAVAMNRIGARSNSGEGGEDENRFFSKNPSENKKSHIKQVASARFGVTNSYLVHAEELQIKIAQGAKPGEGGQLPGHKVNESIARVRHSVPGITLISPPPHHDIYSIEDLAQLIFDLKNANQKARISVKLVSEAGVGTVATGVAKAKADAILISGHEGGTGSSSLSSISHAGLPWELGLAEAQRGLVENNLRSRIVLQVDGQLRTPRDVAIATLLGAEEWGLATGALISLGCIMMRKCHLNTCPVGIATHDPELRKKFAGQPEHLINYIFLLAEGLREIMSELGFKTVDEMVGRSECLEKIETLSNERLCKIDLGALLQIPNAVDSNILHNSEVQNHCIEHTLDSREIIPVSLEQVISGGRISLNLPINNLNRSVGTLISSEITRRIFPKQLQENSLILNFTGTAGQSFMAFAIQGITATINGEVNDYLGKGLSGATVIVAPTHPNLLDANENLACGNTALYGATSGNIFIRGSAGERFAVRNSGAHAVVEGIGDHGCEYMTGGSVVVLGGIGRNFAAGMSGGIAYIYDPTSCSRTRVNHQLAEITSLTRDDDLADLHTQIQRHIAHTQSPLAQFVLRNWEREKENFIVVMPNGFREHLQSLRARNSTHLAPNGVPSELAQIIPTQGEYNGRNPRIHDLPTGYPTAGDTRGTTTALS